MKIQTKTWDDEDGINLMVVAEEDGEQGMGLISGCAEIDLQNFEAEGALFSILKSEAVADLNKRVKRNENQ